jgi:mannan endo-1,4-beta-mannosidase
LPTLLFCCAYASGVLKSVAPHSWHPIEAAPVSETGLGAPLGKRIFGVAIAGNALPKWIRGTGIHPQLLMSFENWSGEPLPTKTLNEDKAVGIHAAMITWEPWQPPRIGSLPPQQFKLQPKFSNKTIANGKWDGYITKWARAVAAFPKIRVYIRFAHEMNGTWYPWSHNPEAYVAAWRRIVTIFRQQHAANAKFVWSGSWGEGPPIADQTKNLRQYWPGKSYVDVIGTTMINFGGTDHTHPVSQYKQRIRLFHHMFHRRVMLTEVNTEQQGRVAWMQHLASYAAHTSWLKGVVWSQDPSYGAANMNVGNLTWQIWQDKSPRAQQAFRELATDVVKPVNPAGISVTAGRGA